MDRMRDLAGNPSQEESLCSLLHLPRPGVLQGWQTQSLEDSPFPLQSVREGKLKQSRDHCALGLFAQPFVGGEGGVGLHLRTNEKVGLHGDLTGNLLLPLNTWRKHGLGYDTVSNSFIHSFKQYLLNQLTHTMHCVWC